MLISTPAIAIRIFKGPERAKRLNKTPWKNYITLGTVITIINIGWHNYL